MLDILTKKIRSLYGINKTTLLFLQVETGKRGGIPVRWFEK
jgi:hypothetical protein